MKSFVYHLQVNVSNKEKSFPFYKELLGLFGYKITHEDSDVLGLSNGKTDLWLVQAMDSRLSKGFHRKNVGLNHIALGVETKGDIDKFVEEFIKPKNLKTLYNSPKEFPEYDKGYYAVYFEDPDRMKIEVIYKPGFEKR